MSKQIKSTVREFFEDESGQGINEYAAIMAFVSMVFMLVFSLSQGSLANALIQSVSGMSGQLYRLIAASANF